MINFFSRKLIRNYISSRSRMYFWKFLLPIVSALMIQGCSNDKENSSSEEQTNESASAGFSVEEAASFKMIVNEFYKENGWSDKGPDWSYFDAAQQVISSASVAHEIQSREGAALYDLFVAATKHVENVMNIWLKMKTDNKPTPPFSQPLIILQAASRLIKYGSPLATNNGLLAADRNVLLKDGMHLLTKVDKGEVVADIYVFTDLVAACKQRFEIDPKTADPETLKNPSICFKQALEIMEARLIINAGRYRISATGGENMSQLPENIIALMGEATSIARVAPDEGPEPAVSVYPKLAQTYDKMLNVMQLFLEQPAISVKERDDRARDLASETQKLMNEIHAEINSQRQN
jgi:hypothetical protein